MEIEVTAEVGAAAGAEAPPCKDNFLDHVKWLRAAVQAQGAELLIAGDSLEALIRCGGRHAVLYPQFIAVVGGVRIRTAAMSGDVTHFAGWLPCRERLAPAARDKLAFKRLAARAGLAVPDFSLEADAAMTDVVVRRAGPSTGGQALGPFRSSSEHPLNLAQGEYYEQFIAGDRLRLWCWSGEPICVEAQPMPGMLHQAAGLRHSDGPAWAGLAAAGRALWKALSDEIRGPTLFTVDAIRAPDHQLWYVGMDNLPEVRPLVYPSVVAGLLGKTPVPDGPARREPAAHSFHRAGAG